MVAATAIDKIYLQRLSTINGITFTPREVDVISCVMHGKTAKGIANFLSTGAKVVSDRSVETHILNIRSKIGVNSKNSIIGFIEKSGKRHLVLEYYNYLLTQTEFNSTLKQIGALVKNKNLSHDLILVCTETDNELIDQFARYLEYIGCGVTRQTDIHAVINNQTKDQYIICYLSKEVEEVISTIDPNKLLGNKILFFSEKEHHQLPGQHLRIDDSLPHYSLLFDILQKCFINPELNTIIQNFNKLHISAHLCNTNVDEATQHESISLLGNLSKAIKNNIKLLLVALTLLSFTALVPYYFTKEPAYKAQIANIGKINNITQQVIKYCSINNIDKQYRENNHVYYKQIEQVVHDLDNRDTYSYFANGYALQKDVVALLYSYAVLANYYNFNNHDGVHARKTLNAAKNLAEQYMLSRSKIKFNFTSLNKEQIFNEINDFPGIREAYTIIAYLIGRTYTYQGNKEDALRYYELSEYLGTKLNLFEGYLSKIGIAKSDKQQILTDITNKSYTSAIDKINKAIQAYESLKRDNTTYKTNYKFSDTEYTIIIPSKNIYNQVECTQEILKYYTLLTFIALNDNTPKNHETIANYITSIHNQLLSFKEGSSLLNLAKSIENKKSAAIYNVLGNILLLLSDLKVCTSKLTQLIKIELSQELLENALFIDKDNKKIDFSELESPIISLNLFLLADKKSRQSDFTKADANNGILASCEKILSAKNISDLPIKSRIEEFAKQYKLSTSQINAKLNRNGDYSDLLKIIGM